MTTMNCRMRQLLHALAVPSRLRRTELSPDLRALAEARLVRVRECYFLEPLLPQGFDIDLSLQNSFDRTGLECSVNDIHLEDYVDERTRNDAAEFLAQGMLYARKLWDRLAVKGHFSVILSFESPGLTEWSDFTSSTVRFHLVRPDEAISMSADLDAFQDAVLVFSSSSSMKSEDVRVPPTGGEI
jgi:hypothetical protein